MSFGLARRPERGRAGTADTDPINGFEFDGSTQFLYIDFRDALSTLVN